jgi:hypothetical protein
VGPCRTTGIVVNQATRLPLVALALQWWRNYPYNRPPAWATAISEMGQLRPPTPLSEARETGVMFNHELPATICGCGIA